MAAAPLDQKLVRRVAHTLWGLDFDIKTPDADTETRKAGWNEDRAAYTTKARRLIRLLNRKDVTLSAGEASEAA